MVERDANLASRYWNHSLGIIFTPKSDSDDDDYDDDDHHDEP